MAAKKEPRPSRVTPHEFEPDLGLDPEPWVPLDERDERGPRRFCRCGLLGEPGDARHPIPQPDPAVVAAALERDAEILGEREVGS